MLYPIELEMQLRETPTLAAGAGMSSDWFCFASISAQLLIGAGIIVIAANREQIADC